MELAAGGGIPAGDYGWVYVGSYFCDTYYAETPPSLWQETFDAIRAAGAQAVLVVPMPGQRRLGQVKAVTERLLADYGEAISEVVVNDYAMLHWIAREAPSLPRWCGRLMCRDDHDPRSVDTGIPQWLYEQAAGGTFDGVSVVGVETDSFGAFNLSGSTTCQLGIHLPLAYILTGRICEFASLGLPATRKLRLESGCARQCVGTWMRYSRDGRPYFKHGRTVYGDNADTTPLAGNSGARLIHSAIADKTKAGKEVRICG